MAPTLTTKRCVHQWPIGQRPCPMCEAAKQGPDNQREQRRYEIARDVFASGYADHDLFTDMAVRAAHAVEAADSLLAALDGKETA